MSARAEILVIGTVLVGDDGSLTPVGWMFGGETAGLHLDALEATGGVLYGGYTPEELLAIASAAEPGEETGG